MLLQLLSPLWQLVTFLLLRDSFKEVWHLRSDSTFWHETLILRVACTFWPSISFSLLFFVALLVDIKKRERLLIRLSVSILGLISASIYCHIQ